MILSKMQTIDRSRDMIEDFKGYNHRPKIKDGEFYEMYNMSSDEYPTLSPRRKRGMKAIPGTGTHHAYGLCAKDGLVYVDNNKIYVNDTIVDGITLTDGKKVLVSMGSYVIVMPDKIFVNTLNVSDFGSLEASYVAGDSSVITYTPCLSDASSFESTVSGTAPVSPSNGDYWVDTSDSPHRLKKYVAETSEWVEVQSTFVKISAIGIASGFNIYDGLRIEGISSSITQLFPLNDTDVVIQDINLDIAGSGAGDFVVIQAMLDVSMTQTGGLILSRRIPTMDFMIESNNRLWGCRYGVSRDGQYVNEIYASKLGDFKNFSCFMGLSTDSYAASCGTDGPFTGAVTFLGYPIFWKENCLHKIYGAYPAQYQMQITNCRGVAKGAGNSLAVVNEVLYYKSVSGVCSYDGSLPVEISQAFGDNRYTGYDRTDTDTLRRGAVGGAYRNKYYICMCDERTSVWSMWVFDSAKGLWHREDTTRADVFAAYEDELYYIDHSTGKIMTVGGTGALQSDPIKWSVTTGIMGTDHPDKKYVSNIVIRMSLAIESRVMFYILYDSIGDWKYLGSVTGTDLKSFSLPLKPKRCDHFRLRIDGLGECRIYSLVKTVERGSTT